MGLGSSYLMDFRYRFRRAVERVGTETGKMQERVSSRMRESPAMLYESKRCAAGLPSMDGSRPNRSLVSVGYRGSEMSVMGSVRQDPATTVQARLPRLGRKSARVMPASSIQFFFSGVGVRSSSSLERNSLRIGEVFALL